MEKHISVRVARWYIFIPKIPLLIYFGRSCNGKVWYILWQIGIFEEHLVHFAVF
jgi:hypothetical protein